MYTLILVRFLKVANRKLSKGKKKSGSRCPTDGRSTKAELQDRLSGLESLLEKLNRSKDRQQETLRELRKKVDAFQAAGQAFVLTDQDAMILDVNESFTSAFGHTRKSLLGSSVLNLASKTNDKQILETVKTALQKKGSWQGEVFCRKKNRKKFPVWLTINALKGKSGKVQNYAATLLNITVFKKTEKMLEQMAHFDMLTSLPNRSLMIDRLNQALSLAKRHSKYVAVMLLDLDRFKEVNDTLGHDVGDKLLVEASDRLTNKLRESDTVARIGGDEFVVILPEISHPNNAAHIAQKFVKALSTPFHLDGHKLYISASIGIAMYPGDGTEPDSLVKNSDTAMYHAKAQGKNNFKFFTEDINKSTVERFLLENRFRQALDKLEFRLNYQPKIDLATGKIAGMEALLRWYHPEQGNVKPGLFIPLAEETGLVVPLGAWALREACRQNKEWQDMGLNSLKVSVNLSPRQFREKNLIAQIREVLDETGLDPKYLMIEITESTIIEQLDDTLQTLEALRDMDIGVSIDDFGTGYSSLNYLHRFPLDELKIDGSFIANLSNHENRKVVNAIITLAKGLNYTVVAEGVETKEHLEYLRSNDCNEVQGYYFSKPLNPVDFHALLKRDPKFIK
jgi:diguanylate cyclase (GGDEF)-like protein/PAS domain S-box-containing protein